MRVARRSRQEAKTRKTVIAQPLAEVVVPGIGLVPVGGVGPQVSLVGRGATYSSVFSATFQAGYFFTPNWSLEVSTEVPLWLNIKITGFSATPPFSGTVLGKLLPGVVPITAVYHFTQLGAIQPYLGGGIVPSFELAVQDGFNTGGSFAPTVGLAAQAGSDYMFNRNWGVFLVSHRPSADPPFDETLEAAAAGVDCAGHRQRGRSLLGAAEPVF